MKTEITGAVNGPHEVLHVYLEIGEPRLSDDHFKTHKFHGVKFPEVRYKGGVKKIVGGVDVVYEYQAQRPRLSRETEKINLV